MGIPVGAKMSEHRRRGEGAAGQGGAVCVSLLILLITFLSGNEGSINVNKPFFNGPNNTGDYVLVYKPFFNATLKPLS